MLTILRILHQCQYPSLSNKSHKASHSGSIPPKGKPPHTRAHAHTHTHTHTHTRVSEAGLADLQIRGERQRPERAGPQLRVRRPAAAVQRRLHLPRERGEARGDVGHAPAQGGQELGAWGSRLGAAPQSCAGPRRDITPCRAVPGQVASDRLIRKVLPSSYATRNLLQRDLMQRHLGTRSLGRRDKPSHGGLPDLDGCRLGDWPAVERPPLGYPLGGGGLPWGAQGRGK